MAIISRELLKVPRSTNYHQLNQTSKELEKLSQELEYTRLEEETNFLELNDKIENAFLISRIASCKLEILRDLQSGLPIDLSLTEKKVEMIEECVTALDDRTLLPSSEKPLDESGVIKLQLKIQKIDEKAKRERITKKLDLLFELARKEISGIDDTNFDFWKKHFEKKVKVSSNKHQQYIQKLHESAKKIEIIHMQAKALDDRKQSLKSTEFEQVRDSRDIFKASELGYIEILEEEIKRTLRRVNEQNDQGSTPLHLAAAHGQLEIVEKLLALGADPTIEDNEKNIPLHWAAKTGDKDIAEKLLAQVNNINHKNKDGRTPLHFAAYYYGRADMVRFLLSRGARINDQAEAVNGVSPLHDAAMKGHRGAIEALVSDRRLDPNLKDAKGFTPFQYAANSRFFGVAACISLHPDWKFPHQKSSLYDVIAFVYAFLTTNKNNPEGNIETPLFSKLILPLIPASPESKKCQFAQALGSAFYLAYQNKDQNRLRITGMKKELSKALGAPDWESGILNSKAELIAFRKPYRDSFMSYDNSLEKPIELDIRVRISRRGSSQITLAYGSSLATNIPSLRNTSGENAFTAVYGAKCEDDKAQDSGYAFGLAEGVDKRRDSYQDLKIRKIAYIAARTYVRFMTAYHNSEALYNDLEMNLGILEKRICDLIPSEEVKSKENKYGIGLLGCRIFPTPNGYHIISLNIGHHMLVAWNPAQKKAYFLSSHTQEHGNGAFPGSYKPEQITLSKKFVPKGCLLFLISKGLHEFLPAEEYTISERLTDEARKRRPHGADGKEQEDAQEKAHVRVLTQLETLLGPIPSKSNPQLFLQALIEKGMEGAEVERKRHLGQNFIKIGDDFAVLQCALD